MESKPRSIPELVRMAAEAYDGRIAVEEGDIFLTYTQLFEKGQDAARAFAAAGLTPGDRVAVWAPNIHEWILAVIGLQSCGGVLVPLNTRLKGAEAAYQLKKSGARILCTVGTFLGEDYVGLLRAAEGDAEDGRPVAGLPALGRIVLLRADATVSDADPQVSGADDAGAGDHGPGSDGIQSWQDFLAAGQSVPADDALVRAAEVDSEDLSDILFTSGTTGNPKGVMTSHGQNLAAFESWSEVVGLKEGDRYLIVNPFFHAFGYKAGWMSALMRGATILPHLVFDVPQVLARVGEERVTVLPGPPALYQSILAHPDRPKYDLSCLRLAVTGAAAIPVELIHAMRDELGFETVITGYGLTEVCGIATMCRFDDEPETIAKTSGRAIDDVEVLCVDDKGEEVPRGEAGEVVVRGYNVMRGYFGDKLATSETIDEDGWLHTGDIGVMDERGYLRITDRIKDMFIMGGFNVYPAEIENMLVSRDDIVQAAVVGVPDERMGEVGMAFVVPAPGATLDPKDVSGWCKENMANYKVPRFLEIVDELPMNAMNKVTKFVLRERADEILRAG